MRVTVNAAILCLFLLSACQPIAFALYGIKKPRPVPAQQIRHKALDLGLDTSRLFVIRQEHYPTVMNAVSTFPNLFIFDKAGNRYNYRGNPDECKASAADFIRNLRQGAAYDHPADSAFLRLPQQIETLQGMPFALENLPEADFYLFAYWGTFLGKLNRNYVAEWNRLVQQNRQARLALFFISCDLRVEWGDKYWKSWEKEAGQ